MRSIYDAVKVKSTIGPILVTGTLAGTTSTGSAVDTKGYNTAMLYVSAGKILTGGGTLTVTLQESASATSGFANALDNSGTVIGFTLVTTDAFNEGQARIEGLGLNRLRYLKAVTSYAASATGTGTVVATILLGRAYAEPVNTAVSNT